MNADSTFHIGKDHVICEDYALAEVKAGLAYAIVCDGCSASPEVDFGARVMAMVAKNTILRAGPLCHNDLDKFGSLVVLSANRVFDIFPHLHPQALDSTLLVAMVYNNTASIIMYGDGLVVRKYDDKYQFIHVHLSSGAPDYLSYHLDKGRKESYDKMEDNTKIVVTQNIPDIKVKPFEPIFFQTEVRKDDVIAVISDGIGSFRKQDNSQINWQELLPEFMGFKTFEGEFVKRRIGAFQRKCFKENTTHGDDISIAAIVV